jgi:hypothetical protein
MEAAASKSAHPNQYQLAIDRTHDDGQENGSLNNHGVDTCTTVLPCPTPLRSDAMRSFGGSGGILLQPSPTPPELSSPSLPRHAEQGTPRMEKEPEGSAQTAGHRGTRHAVSHTPTLDRMTSTIFPGRQSAGTVIADSGASRARNWLSIKLRDMK